LNAALGLPLTNTAPVFSIQVDGNTKSFHVNPEYAQSMPLYIQPIHANFGLVDAIFIPNDNSLFLLQVTVSQRHSLILQHAIHIFQSLRSSKIKIDEMDIWYCLVGRRKERVQTCTEDAKVQLGNYKLTRQPSKQNVALVKRMKVWDGVVFEPYGKSEMFAKA
jgi:hypothetical protein